ncbi:MAG: flagellar hook-basal body complex protein [Butyrivibrio sp.]|nr:flagellar hook-basal body complex protein [Butyrivibrio sp.]
MMKSLFSGVAGLRTHQTKMDVIGNNIANVNTTSFKSQSITFSDLMYQTTQSATAASETKGGVNPRQIGLGSKSGAIGTAIDTQGATQTTNNPFDMMITGDSFFIVNDGAQTKYTRDGSFYVDGAGNLAMQSTGYYVYGWSAVEDTTTGEITVNTNGGIGKLQIMSAENTTYPPAGTTQGVVSGNIDANDTNVTSDSGKTVTLEFYDNLGYLYTAKFSVRDVDNLEHTYTLTLDDILDSDGNTIGADKMQYVSFTDSETGNGQTTVTPTGYTVSSYTDTAITLKSSTTYTDIARSGDVSDLSALYAQYPNFFREIYEIDDDVIEAYISAGSATDTTVNYSIASDGTLTITTSTVADAEGSVSSSLKSNYNYSSDFIYTNGTTNYTLPTGAYLDVDTYGDILTTVFDVDLTSYSDSATYMVSGSAASPTLTITDSGTSVSVSTLNSDISVASGATATISISDGSNNLIAASITPDDSYDISSYADADALFTAYGYTASDYTDGTVGTDGSFQIDSNGKITITYNYEKTTTSSTNYSVANSSVSSYDSSTISYASSVYEDIDRVGYVTDITKSTTTANFFKNVYDLDTSSLDSTETYEILSDGTLVLQNNNVTMTFNPKTGAIVSPSGKITMDFNQNAVDDNGQLFMAGFTDVAMDLSTITNYNTKGTSTIKAVKGDLSSLNTGRSVGEMNGITIGTDGKINATYSNGQTKLLGQIATAQFANASGLSHEGDNLYTETLNSGTATVQDITVDGGYMNTGVLEMSNVDLSNEFTNMITTQRGFQANSRIITVSDTLLEELTNLKR